MAKQLAVVMSFNWKTDETLHTKFEGKNAALRAEAFLEQGFLQKDFPEKKGWTHFLHWNEAAGKARADRLIAVLMPDN